jgi:N-acetylneuraminate synthase
VFVVAELSGNHGQSFDAAVKLVHLAKDAGADAIKLQTYTADTITIPSGEEWFRIEGGTLWDGRTLHDLYQESFTPWEWQPKLQAIARELGLQLFASAFDPTAVDFLERMGVPAHKIASPDLLDILLIEKMARTGKPLILSTGMASLAEIEEAVTAARRAGAAEICLLKCTSSYPAQPQHPNLRTLADLATRFEVPVGFSDHTLGCGTAIAAVALGACVIEKHFTASRLAPGPDSAFSAEPDEFRAMVSAIRTAERSLGAIHYGPTSSELRMLKFRRSLFIGRCQGGGNIHREERRLHPPGTWPAPAPPTRGAGTSSHTRCAQRNTIAVGHDRGSALRYSTGESTHLGGSENFL